MTTVSDSVPQAPALRGDALSRRSRRAFLWAIGLAIPGVLLSLFIRPVWAAVASLSGGGFALAAGGFALAITALPLGILVTIGVAVFARVESAISPRSTPVGRADYLCVVGGVLLSLLPAAWPASMVVRALKNGQITIRQPVLHTFSVTDDPLAYWQNLGFWLIATIVLAGAAGLYWRSRWRIARRNPPPFGAANTAPLP